MQLVAIVRVLLQQSEKLKQIIVSPKKVAILHEVVQGCSEDTFTELCMSDVKSAVPIFLQKTREATSLSITNQSCRARLSTFSRNCSTHVRSFLSIHSLSCCISLHCGLAQPPQQLLVSVGSYQNSSCFPPGAVTSEPPREKGVG